MHTDFKVFFKFFHLFKKVNKQKGAMLDRTKTPSMAELRKLLSNKIAKCQWAQSYTFFQEELATAARDVECTTLRDQGSS